jgi:hypothetical protein
MDYYEDALERWKTLMTARGFDPEALLTQETRAKSCR